ISLKPRQTVDFRGFLQFVRNLLEGTGQQPDRERKVERRVWNNQAPVVIDESRHANQLIERKQKNNRRKEGHGEQARADEGVRPAANTGQTVGRKRRRSDTRETRQRSNREAVQVIEESVPSAT